MHRHINNHHKGAFLIALAGFISIFMAISISKMQHKYLPQAESDT